MIPINPPAVVEVNEEREYVDANPSACALLGYTREELLKLRIDDVSYPSGAHVSPMFARYREDGGLKGRFAVQTKSGQVLWIRYESEVSDGRLIARWTEYEPIPRDVLEEIRQKQLTR